MPCFVRPPVTRNSKAFAVATITAFISGFTNAPIVRVVWAKYPFDMLGALPNRGEQVTIEHDAIMEGLRIRDARATMRAMQRHLESGHRLFKANYGLWAGREPRRP